MKKIVLLALLLASGAAPAQDQPVIDSLLQQLSIAKEDTNKVRLLDELSWQYVGNVPSKAMYYAQEALALAKKINYPRGIAAGYSAVGHVHYEMSEFTQALEAYMNTVKAGEAMGDRGVVLRVYNNISNVYGSMGETEKCLEYLFMSVEEAKRANNKASLGTAYNNIAIVYKRKKEYDKALEYHLQGLAIRKEVGNKKSIAGSLNNLGVLSYEMKQYEKALDYYRQSLEIKIELNDQAGLASTYNNMGQTYNGMKQWEKGLEYNRKGLHYSILSGNKNWRHASYGNLVDTYDGLKDYKNQSYWLFRYIELNDTLFNEDKAEQLASMRTKHETAEKEKENLLLTSQNQLQASELSRSRYLMFGLGGLVLLVLVIGWLVLRQSRLQSAQRNMQLEQKLLRSQMNPHFIFNSLIAIESFIYKNEPREAGKYLSGFARLMRLILENSREEYISLATEIKTLEHYLELQKLRFDEKFTYSIELAPGMDAEAIAIPPMLAQPFIENSIEHGLKNMDKQGEIRIRFSVQNNQLLFEVSDNGIGIERSMEIKRDKEKHQSLATLITKERLSILNKGKSGKVRLAIGDLKDSLNNLLGTQVSFTVPFRQI